MVMGVSVENRYIILKGNCLFVFNKVKLNQSESIKYYAFFLVMCCTAICVYSNRAICFTALEYVYLLLPVYCFFGLTGSTTQKMNTCELSLKGFKGDR